MKDELIPLAEERMEGCLMFVRLSLSLDPNRGLTESPPGGQKCRVPPARTLRRLSRGYGACSLSTLLMYEDLTQ